MKYCKSTQTQIKTQNPKNQTNLSKYYEKTVKNEYFPRSILVDLDPAGLNLPLNSPILKNSIHITGKIGAGNNWAKGHYTDGAEIMDDLLELTRKKVENCEFLQGFQICMSMGGGTGSGMGSSFVYNIKQEYPSKFLNAFTTFPSFKVPNAVVEPYNVLLGLNVLLDCCDCIIAIDNDKILEICVNELGIQEPLFSDLNYLIGMAMSNLSSCNRFKGTDCLDFEKLAINLTPFPKLKILTVGLSPILYKNCNRISSLSLSSIIHEIYSSKNMFCFFDSVKSRHLASAGIFIGRVSSQDLENFFSMMKLTQSSLEWIPDNNKNFVYEGSHKHAMMTGTLLTNTTAIQEPLQRFHTKFKLLHSKNAFLQYYLCEGMDGYEFIEADLNVSQTIQLYQQAENII